MNLNENNLNKIKNKYLNIFRICLRRSLKNYLILNKKEKLEIYIQSEFNEDFNDNNFNLIIQQCEFLFSIINSLKQEIFTISLSNFNLNSNSIIFHFITPSEIGSYQYLIKSLKSPENCFILPFLSSEIEIVETIPSNWNILCQNYRLLNYFFHTSSSTLNQIMIKEDRGLTMGSHLWDSSIILFLNFQNIFELPLQTILQNKSSQSNLNIIELGAGCSLIGILFAKYLQETFDSLPFHIYCTDLSTQLSLINENIILNQLNFQQISSHELNWSSQANIQQFISTHLSSSKSNIDSPSLQSESESESESGIDVVIASDVLYQNDMTIHFFNTLLSLPITEKTLIIVAQKLRTNKNGLTSLDCVDLKLFEQFQSIIIHEEANVIVWQLILNVNNHNKKEK